eukprot:CAMPEP_0171847910 /NCGR_PEP_ID=MMETSP0992-20121227/18678_1 /TAXON_ID=483369 /ORGANISM="non described non described, Strain CCMP2098" /LENGTH=209 /DNA_ID=CAMNT_0012466651 /DNA_START=133 /DNA_END=762 /DNA_ORIENTATION=+
MTDESGSDSDDGRGASAAVQWVACDKCSQWRKLSGLTDLKSLPKKWFCKLNPDQNYNDCSIPQEEEEDPEQRLRAHLRLWARRLKLADEAETRLPMAHGTRAARRTRGVGEQEWVRCCDPNCGKWRALHRSMDCSNLGSGLDKEWYCVMNSWDEALASCAAPQEVPSEAHHVHWVGATAAAWSTRTTRAHGRSRAAGLDPRTPSLPSTL